jgi:hypothetical protein
MALFMIVLWLPQVFGRQPHFRRNGLAAAGLGLAAVLACVGSLPHLFVGYLHVARAEMNGRSYQLGVRTGADETSFYLLCACDRFGWQCQCKSLPAAGSPNFVDRPRLVADASMQTLSIVVGTEIVYTVAPLTE